MTTCVIYDSLWLNSGACSGTVGWFLTESLKIFHRHKPWGCTADQGSTQPPTEMETRDILVDKCGRSVKLTTLPPSCVNYLEILGA